ncbi:non-specific lipid-transfer protein-like protein [Dorcoceras hygrometricum]|uniref:Non-specific lipid-transfer protein-like protein n=1 Tax=Dorcoceras hygrometricum TaxID=472368 RepID=A0A2Z7BAM8_9LAMI|nr:non-specific lipid-transfer protein-like protein [Dorcoceras hygrometricum]
MALFSTSSGQTTTSPCTSSMITSFMPCVNFVTNGTINSTAPPPACCNSLGSLMSNGKECLCQIATGNVPFQIPVNQSLAISLPRACNMPGVPLQCKAVGAPVPAPGPLANGQITLPPSSAPTSPKGPSDAEPLSPRSTPEAEPTTPTSPPTTTGAPAGNTGSRARVTPSAAGHSFTASSPLLLVAMLGCFAFNF